MGMRINMNISAFKESLNAQLDKLHAALDRRHKREVKSFISEPALKRLFRLTATTSTSGASNTAPTRLEI